MPAPVRFPNGVTNVGPTDLMANYLRDDPTRLYTFFDDFTLYTAANWTVTETQAAATQAVDTGSIISAASGANGVMLLTNATGNTDVNQIQYINETFVLPTNKQWWLKSRFSYTATAANFGISVGLMITDTTAVAGVSDGIYFRKPTGSSTLSAVISKASADTSITLGTLATSTYTTCGLYFNGKDEIVAYMDGVKVGSTTTLTTIPVEELAVTLASVNATTGAANVLAVDYILASVER